MRTALYLMLGFGVFFINSERIKYLLSAGLGKFRLKRNLAKLNTFDEYRNYGKLLGSIRKLLISVNADSRFKKPEYFLMFSVLVGIGALFALVWTQGIAFSVEVAIIASFMPTLYLRIKLAGKRVGNSREGDLLLQELLSQYKINDFNIKEAVMVAAFSIENAPNSKKLLYDLAKGLNQAYSSYDIELVLRKLEYSINTAWGNALAQIIYYASVKGVLVTEALSDLAESLGRSRKIIEHAKRENSESLTMIKYLAPISYLLSIFFALRFFGFSIGKFCR